jgi:hypothetical protein
MLPPILLFQMSKTPEPSGSGSSGSAFAFDVVSLFAAGTTSAPAS